MQFRQGMAYVCITFVVLLFLNIYSSQTSQKLFIQSKEASMFEKCHLAAAEIAKLEVLTSSNVTDAISRMDSLRNTRLIVVDHTATALYDSYSKDSSVGSYVLLPEVVSALDGTLGNDVFSWEYQNGIMRSRGCTPIVAYGAVIGCVYMMEYDEAQGGLIQSLQTNILSITLVLEAIVILFSIIFAAMFSSRLRRVLSSMRIIRSGDYSHRVNMGGNDQLTSLGDEFNRLTERLQQSEDQRRQFVSDASHELKTPLASIKLLSDSILQNDMDMQTVREFVGDIGEEAERLNRMSQKLLALSKSEHLEETDCEIIRMRPTIDRVRRMLSTLAEESNISIETIFEEDCPILIPADDLYEITFNLVENGIKYNCPDGKLTISTFRNGDNAMLQVSNTGIGIPEEAQSRVFERFYRVDKARSRSTGGSGLGLSIVYDLVRRNQGDITLSSTPGERTTFTVSFPVFDPEEVSE